jgi:hypothetical protein
MGGGSSGSACRGGLPGLGLGGRCSLKARGPNIGDVMAMVAWNKQDGESRLRAASAEQLARGVGNLRAHRSCLSLLAICQGLRPLLSKLWCLRPVPLHELRCRNPHCAVVLHI